VHTLRVAGGRVLRPDHSVERADVTIDTDGGIVTAVGPSREMPTPDETLDASDGLVIPGLVNAHAHGAMTLLRGYADDKPLAAWLQEDVWPVEAALEPADVRAGIDLAILEMIKSGTTAFADMYFEMDQVVAAVEEAGVRARIGHGIVTVGRDEEAASADVAESVRVAREFDGTADGRVRTAVMPHSLTTVGEPYLREAVTAARDAGVPVHIHVSETTDEVEPILEDRGVRPLEYAAKIGLLEDDDWLAHCVHLDETEVELVSDRESAVAHCPASNMKLASGMAPVQRLRDAGVTVALGTDGPASNNDLDMFDEMRDAAMLGPLQTGDAAAVSADAVVEMATQAGATALGFDCGRIEPGAAADLAVLDLEQAHLTPEHELVSHLAYAARGSDVRHTVCDGAVLMRDREVQGLEPTAIRERAAQRAHDLVQRA
jgi:5-methylthioadenosine/S-adenosylhomocysteine deaminase